MNIKEFIVLCEEILELEEGTLEMETRLEDIDEWDSLTRMDLVAYCDDKFNTTLPIEIFKDAIIFHDVIKKVEKYLMVKSL